MHTYGRLSMASIGVIGLQFQDVDNNAKKENASNKASTSNILPVKNFIKSYTENAKAINAKYDFDWTLEKGEKADIIKLILNDSVQWSITTQKNENKTVIGSVLFITTPEEKKQEEALLSLYAMIKTYEPNLADAVIKNFVANFINQKDSDTYKSQNIIYTKKSLGNTFMLFIRYENLNDDI